MFERRNERYSDCRSHVSEDGGVRCVLGAALMPNYGDWKIGICMMVEAASKAEVMAFAKVDPLVPERRLGGHGCTSLRASDGSLRLIGGSS